MIGAGTPVLESDRFELRRRIGAGGFGVVYEAFDREREAVVALKMLHRLDAKGLYRFKQEFRSLSDIAHENLITLHELLSHAGQWYFTMEFIEGGTILDYVWNVSGGAGPDAITPSKGSSDGPTETIARLDQLASQADASSANFAVHPSLTARLIASENINRLRDAVRGLAEGLSAIHRHGIVHQDVKPANVMVTPSGRVVLLDFGLAKNVAVDVTASTQVSGTPAYMSPEQASGRPLSEATDWYAVGVVMYQALTGRLPHSGPLLELLAAKQSTDPPAPSTLAPQIPSELDDLCMDLLRRDPAGRPGVAEILRRLGGTVRSARPAAAGATPAITARLVGRDRHLEQLR
ncbi:MAG: serine/threonine-protein kinase, partial [Acidobacteriota bacterium]|nr:serine/threonine-protein kinase [Acidobacteriota bacterium]